MLTAKTIRYLHTGDEARNQADRKGVRLEDEDNVTFDMAYSSMFILKLHPLLLDNDVTAFPLEEAVREAVLQQEKLSRIPPRSCSSVDMCQPSYGSR